jgi:hypothetical protein
MREDACVRSAASLFLLLGVFAAVAPVADAAERCAGGAGSTLTVSRFVEVERFADRRVEACHRLSGERVVVGYLGTPGTIRNVRAAGHRVAFEEHEFGGYQSVTLTVVYDLRRPARPAVRIPNGTPPGYLEASGSSDFVGAGPTTDLELTRAGSVMWIVEQLDPVTNAPVYEVWSLRAGRRSVHRRARGPAIGPTSLRVAGSRFTWRDSSGTSVLRLP